MHLSTNQLHCSSTQKRAEKIFIYAHRSRYYWGVKCEKLGNEYLENVDSKRVH